MTTAVRTAIISGIILIIWAVITYIISDPNPETGKKSFTIFIPAGFGLLIATFGAIAIKEAVRKHAMHVAALVGLLGLLGGFGMGLKKIFTEANPKWLAVTSQLFLGVVCLIFLITCIRSFIAARRGA